MPFHVTDAHLTGLPAASATPAVPAPDGAGLQAVLFDMDGLLINSEPLWFQVETEVMARLGGTWNQSGSESISRSCSAARWTTRCATSWSGPPGRPTRPR